MLDTKKAAHMLSDKIWGWGELLRTIFGKFYLCNRDLPVAQTVKRLPTMQETTVQFLGLEDLLEKEMATHSSILA